MRRIHHNGIIIALLACSASVGMAAPAEGPVLAAFAGVEQGQWQLRELGERETRTVCLGSDPRALMQVEHGRAQCTVFVIANEAKSAVIHYTCPGAGHGRTTMTVETARLIKLHTQGISSGAPFDHSYEARRTGACAAGGRGR